MRRMVSGAFFGPVALLYYLCSLALAGLALFVAWTRSRRSAARAALRRIFFLLALSLLTWILTLFLEVRTASPGAQLWLGRLNFAAVAVAAHLALRFVQEVPVRPRPSRRSPLLLLETGLVAAVTLLTPLVTAAERVEAGRALTTFGPLFPGYLLHVTGHLAAAVVLAFGERRRSEDRKLHAQLALISVGMLATGAIALTTNGLLPFAFGYFGLCDVGVLSTVCFTLAVTYATFIHGLFDLRVLVRETLVYGILLAFILGAYSSAVFVVSQYLTTGAEKLTQFVVLCIAFSFDPLRRLLEERVDQLLFGMRKRLEKEGRRKARSRSGLVLALLFPWRER